MKITIYELLGMIKEGKAPKKIKFDTERYIWCEDQKEYRRYPYDNNLYYSLYQEYDLIKCLNEEVEIIEPQEHKIPEKLDQTLNRVDIEEDYYRYIMENRFKINEILDYLEEIE